MNLDLQETLVLVVLLEPRVEHNGIGGSRWQVSSDAVYEVFLEERVSLEGGARGALTISGGTGHTEF